MPQGHTPYQTPSLASYHPGVPVSPIAFISVDIPFAHRPRAEVQALRRLTCCLHLSFGVPGGLEPTASAAGSPALERESIRKLVPQLRISNPGTMPPRPRLCRAQAGDQGEVKAFPSTPQVSGGPGLLLQGWGSGEHGGPSLQERTQGDRNSRLRLALLWNVKPTRRERRENEGLGRAGRPSNAKVTLLAGRGARLFPPHPAILPQESCLCLATS